MHVEWNPYLTNYNINMFDPVIIGTLWDYFPLSERRISELSTFCRSNGWRALYLFILLLKFRCNLIFELTINQLNLANLPLLEEMWTQFTFRIYTSSDMSALTIYIYICVCVCVCVCCHRLVFSIRRVPRCLRRWYHWIMYNKGYSIFKPVSVNGDFLK